VRRGPGEGLRRAPAQRRGGGLAEPAQDVVADAQRGVARGGVRADCAPQPRCAGLQVRKHGARRRRRRQLGRVLQQRHGGACTPAGVKSIRWQPACASPPSSQAPPRPPAAAQQQRVYAWLRHSIDRRKRPPPPSSPASPRPAAARPRRLRARFGQLNSSMTCCLRFRHQRHRDACAPSKMTFNSLATTTALASAVIASAAASSSSGIAASVRLVRKSVKWQRRPAPS